MLVSSTFPFSSNTDLANQGWKISVKILKIIKDKIFMYPSKNTKHFP